MASFTDMLRTAGRNIQRNIGSARDYFSVMQNMVNSAGTSYESGAFNDAHKRMGKLLENSPTTFTEYYSSRRENLSANIMPEHFGKLVMFRYNAKMKDELPYWDRYPLVMPIEKTKKGHLLGLNLHYLHPRLRAALLDEIVDNNARNKFYENKRIRFNYAIMQRAAKNSLYKPCVKQYIMESKHIQTKFLIVPPDEYKFVLFLPYDMFQKKSREYVWADSIRKIKKAAY